MDEQKELAHSFEANRRRLRAVALRMLGSVGEAEDAVQDAWLRVSRAETSEVTNLGGYLTTVVARVCLDMLRARKARPEHREQEHAPRSLHSRMATAPRIRCSSPIPWGRRLLVVLETLSPAERLAFVLHDMFDLPFDEIAVIAGCSEVSARQLASRARRRVQGATLSADVDPDLSRQREAVDAFLAASRTGNLAGLLALLDPQVVLRSDDVAAQKSTASEAAGGPSMPSELRGSDGVARAFLGRAHAAKLALIDGSIGATWAPGGKVRVAFVFTIAEGRVVAIDVIADPEFVDTLDVTILST